MRRIDRTNAEQVLKAHQGYCQHQPACGTSAACVNKIARDFALKRLGRAS